MCSCKRQCPIYLKEFLLGCINLIYIFDLSTVYAKRLSNNRPQLIKLIENLDKWRARLKAIRVVSTYDDTTTTTVMMINSNDDINSIGEYFPAMTSEIIIPPNNSPIEMAAWSITSAFALPFTLTIRYIWELIPPLYYKKENQNVQIIPQTISRLN